MIAISPFTFYRGAAAIMAADLAATPVAGLEAQLCGDAHLSNFGAFASPERRLLFDLNDFDETLPGPFEYDVKRMAASFTIAARNNGFSKADAREATLASVTCYRQAMASFAQMRTMDVWYAHLDEDQVTTAARGAIAGIDEQARATGKGARKKAKKEKKEAKKAQKAAQKAAEKAHTRDSLQALSKLGELVDGQYRIVSQPPIVIPARDLAPMSGVSPDDLNLVVRQRGTSGQRRRFCVHVRSVPRSGLGGCSRTRLRQGQWGAPPVVRPPNRRVGGTSRGLGRWASPDDGWVIQAAPGVRGVRLDM